MKEKPVVIDLFCGAGGESQGIHWAMGDDIKLFAVNHWAVACETHAKNFPSDECICQDITTVIPTNVVPNRKVALMWASPECFPAGTLILTDKGYMPIETVKEGDMVLTHKGRWRKVTSTMTSEKSVVEVKGYGHYGLTVTEAHPFYVSSRKDICRHRGVERQFSQPSFMALKDIEKLANYKDTTVYWSRPASVEPLGVPQIPVINGRAFDINADMMWLAGRYVADGYVRLDDENGEVAICCGDDKLGKAMRRLSVWKRKGNRSGSNEMVWHTHVARTAINLTTDSRGVAMWLSDNFGKLAHGKKVPSWLYGADEELRWSFIEGYLSGDGCLHNGVFQCTTVSRELAIGLATLLGTVGVPVQMMKPRLRQFQIIEGRTVNCRQQYVLKWKGEIAKGHSQTPSIDETHLWSAIKQFRHLDEVRTVYNLSVEEDESYVVEGICVHNCTHFSSARGGKPCDAQSRCTPWDILRWATMLDIDRIIVENVKEFRSWGPLDGDNRPIQELKGVYFDSWYTAMAKLGYKADWRVLNAADYGAPTTRSRLFIQFSRKDIVWPDPTHCEEPDFFNNARQQWIPAKDIIDWDEPCQLIEERKKPLCDKTMNRIFQGIKRYWGDGAKPFLARYNGGDNRVHSIDDPVPTLDCSNRYGLVQPLIVKFNNGQTVESINQPLSTVACSGAHHGLIEPLIVPYYGNSKASSVSSPLPTVTAKERFALVKPGEKVGIGFRMLKPDELARAQSFPDSYEFTGPKADVVKQIGNAVCPKMAEALVGSIA